MRGGRSSVHTTQHPLNILNIEWKWQLLSYEFSWVLKSRLHMQSWDFECPAPHFSLAYWVCLLNYLLYMLIPGTFQESGVIQEAYNFNHPMRTTKMPYSGRNTSTRNNITFLSLTPAYFLEMWLLDDVTLDSKGITYDILTVASWPASFMSRRVLLFLFG